jgi:GTP-binding protein HflX
LARMWSHLDTVTGASGGPSAGAVGAIGTRGPGEQQLEIDRRLVSKRLNELRHELASIDTRKLREIKARKDFFQVCIVGYTNSGKSTLLNALTDAGVLAEDRLFATLDTRTRKWTPARGVEILLSDTVGFVRNLPHQLVESFKATLEETVNADLLLHVIDVANPDVMSQMESVNKVLSEIGCGDKPVLELFNKADIIKDVGPLEMLQTLHPESVTISARTGLGLDEMTRKVIQAYRGRDIVVRVTCSAGNGKVQSFLRAHGTVVDEQYTDCTVVLDVRMGHRQFPELERLHPDGLEVVQG